jgi:thiamine kinase-like enzyme
LETQLPGTIGLIVTAVLRRYRDWQGVDRDEAEPSVVRLLGDQSNNVSVLVANSRFYVVRVNRADAAVNALDPAAEQAAQLRAAEAGLAPALRYFEPEAGVTVSDYLQPDHTARATPDQLAELLRGIHSLEAIPQRLSLADRIRHYGSKRAPTGSMETGHVAAAVSGAIIDGALELESRDCDIRLCHNDLLPPNCLFKNGRLWAIDWEYAAMGSRWFDIAAASIGHHLDAEKEEILVGTYLGRTPLSAERELLALARDTYRGIEELWHAVNSLS